MVDVLKTKDFFGPDGFPIEVAPREPQPPFPRHWHQFSELIIVTGGSGLHVIRDESYPVTAGDVFVIKDQSPHEYQDMNALALINILYDPVRLGMSRWDVRSLPGYHALFKLEPRYRRKHRFESRLRLHMEDLSSARVLTRQLEKELTDRKAGFRLLATSHFMALVGFLSRCYGESRATHPRALLRIGEAISYIEEHSSEDIDLDTLARIANMSRRNFSRTFRDAMGRSAIDYLLHLRLARAREMLRDSNATVTDVAFRTGFSDSSYFSRQFHKIIGQTPSEYQRANAAGK